MATTTNYGWTTPDDTSLVKDGASAIRSLGTAIDTSLNTALGTKKAGMVLLKTYSPTAVSSLSLDANTFTSTYKNYVIKGYLRNTTTTSVVTIRYRAAGIDASGADYNYQELFAGSTTVTGTRGTGLTNHTIMVLGSTWDANIELNIYRPQQAAITNFNGNNFRSDAVSLMTTGGYHNQAVSYDSMSFINSSSNFTGQIQVFGVNE